MFERNLESWGVNGTVLARLYTMPCAACPCIKLRALLMYVLQCPILGCIGPSQWRRIAELEAREAQGD